MDILIKDAILPSTNCYGCRFFKEEHYEDVYEDRVYQVIGECLAGEFQIEKPYYPNDGGCPLVALPSHGRLIDASELETYYSDIEADNGTYTEDAGETLRTIQNAPTIVEAST